MNKLPNTGSDLTAATAVLNLKVDAVAHYQPKSHDSSHGCSLDSAFSFLYGALGSICTRRSFLITQINGSEPLGGLPDLLLGANLDKRPPLVHIARPHGGLSDARKIKLESTAEPAISTRRQKTREPHRVNLSSKNMIPRLGSTCSTKRKSSSSP